MTRGLIVDLPKQARGRARFESLLSAASDLIAEEGVDGVAFSKVARRTGTAQGSLYQYFPCKEALVATLHARLARAVVELVTACRDEFAALEGPKGIAVLARLLVPRLARFYAENPAYREIRHALPRNPDIAATEIGADAEIARLLSDMIAEAGVSVPPRRHAIVAEALIEAGDALLPWAAGDPGRIAEVETLVAGYLGAASG